MSMTVGVREFRKDLADYIDQSEPVTVTRHGQTVGLFIPVAYDREAALAAYVAAAKKANDALVELGITEDDVVADFKAMRKAERNRDQR